MWQSWEPPTGCMSSRGGRAEGRQAARGGLSRSSPRSRLRRLWSAPLRLLFNVGGKLWILREHVVERVFIECVEVTVVHGADTGSARLHEEQGEFPEELALREGSQRWRSGAAVSRRLQRFDTY
jgi:hypothetical protein